MDGSPGMDASPNRGFALGNKLGPLPLWGWGVALLGAVLVFIYVKRHQGSASPSSISGATSTPPLGTVSGQIQTPTGQVSFSGPGGTQDLATLLSQLNPPGTQATGTQGTPPTTPPSDGIVPGRQVFNGVVPRPGGGTNTYNLSGQKLQQTVQIPGWSPFSQDLPGLWQSITNAGYNGETAFVEGIGTDNQAWRTTWAPGMSGWTQPTRM